MMSRTLALLAASILGSVLASACTDDVPTASDPITGGTAGGSGNTFDHPDDNTISPWELLDRLTKEGPPSFTSHMHSCPKVKYAALGNILSGLGVTVTSTSTSATGVTAGDLYVNGMAALGAANYANRIRENVSITTSGASREFDIFAAGAPQIITAFAAHTIARCSSASLFDGTTGACQSSGITCLIGTPATADHVSFCNLTVTSATDTTTGKQLAVAALLAAAYTCE